MSEKIDTPKYPNGVYPELSPNPDFHNGLEDKTSETANTQVVNEPKVQSPKDFDLDDIIALIQKYAPEGISLPEVTAADNGKVLEVLAGAWAKGNKKVNVIDAPSSTILDDETIAKFEGGIFINGVFANLKNPIICPAVKDSNGVYYGVVIGKQSAFGTAIMKGYYIINKVFYINELGIVFNVYGNAIELTKISKINNNSIVNDMLKILTLSIPADASTSTYVPKLVNGTWTLVKES